MPVSPTYPGVYIEEIPSGVRTITGVATSITAFLGRALFGSVDEPVTINSYSDFERQFGGLAVNYPLSYAVRDYYLNGGSQAIIVRLFGAELSDSDHDKAQAAADAVADAAVGANAAGAAAAAKVVADTYTNDPERSAAKAVLAAVDGAAATPGATPDQVTAAARAAASTAVPAAVASFSVGGLELVAASKGRWGANLRISIDFKGIPLDSEVPPGALVTDRFNLTVRDAGSGGSTERFTNLTIRESARRIDRVLKAQSALVGWSGDLNPQTEAETLGSLLTALKTLDEKAEELKTAKEKLPPVDDDIKAAERAFDTAQTVADTAMLDTVSQKEKDLADKKKKLTLAQVSGEKIDEAKAAVNLAQKAADTARKMALDAVSDGRDLKATDFLPPDGETDKKGLYALEQADLFNLLCIPPYTTHEADLCNVDDVVVSAATAYCEKRRAIHLIDPGSVAKPALLTC